MSSILLEKFYYEQDDNKATVITINHQRHYVEKLKNYPIEYCTHNCLIKYVSFHTATILLKGLISDFYIVQEKNYDNESPSNEQNRRFLVCDRINKRFSNPDYYKYIVKERDIYSNLNKKRLEYTILNDRYFDSLGKCDRGLLDEFLHKFSPSNDTDMEIMNELVDILKNKDKNGYSELKKKLMQDKHYAEADEISKEMPKVFFEFLDALIETEQFMAEEYKLFSDKYKTKMDEYAEQGLFLYCQNTPDLPIDDDDITIDDIYNHFLNDDAMYLKGIFEVFVQFGDAVGDINKREADDLVASYHLLIEGKYWAALRNLYSLIDHHHKLCADIFNGFENTKEKFRNGKERSNYIGRLFEKTKVFYYEEVWHKLDAAIGEMNTNSGKRFVSRNSIVHGDYEIPEVNPQAKDVINVFMLYVTLRQMIDHMANIEEATRDFYTYYLGYSKLKQ